MLLSPTDPLGNAIVIGLATFAGIVGVHLSSKLAHRLGLIPAKLRTTGAAAAGQLEKTQIIGSLYRIVRRRPFIGSLTISAGVGIFVASIPYLLMLFVHVLALLIVIFVLLNGGIETEEEEENVFSGSSYGPSDDIGSYDEEWSIAMGKLTRP